MSGAAPGEPLRFDASFHRLRQSLSPADPRRLAAASGSGARVEDGLRLAARPAERARGAAPAAERPRRMAVLSG